MLPTSPVGAVGCGACEQGGAPRLVRSHNAHQGGRAALFGEEAQSYLCSLWYCSVRPVFSFTAPGGARAARGAQRKTAYNKMLCKQPQYCVRRSPGPLECPRAAQHTAWRALAERDPGCRAAARYMPHAQLTHSL